MAGMGRRVCREMPECAGDGRGRSGAGTGNGWPGFMGREPAEYIVYPDHHAYTPRRRGKAGGARYARDLPPARTPFEVAGTESWRNAWACCGFLKRPSGPQLWAEAAFPHWLDAWGEAQGAFSSRCVLPEPCPIQRLFGSRWGTAVPDGGPCRFPRNDRPCIYCSLLNWIRGVHIEGFRAWRTHL